MPKSGFIDSKIEKLTLVSPSDLIKTIAHLILHKYFMMIKIE